MLPPGAAAQVPAADSAIIGQVTDAAGGVLPGVSVEARPSDGGRSLLTTSDTTGRYRFDGVAPGRWDLTFTLVNFAAAVHRDVAVADRQQVVVDSRLMLRLTAQVVVSTTGTFRELSGVTRDADLIGIASSATSGVVSGRRLGDRPIARPGDLTERVPGVIITQHSGEGKANQYYVRGFNIDHGTDLALSVAGLPVNLPTNGHGQGYADLNFVIPELVSAIQYKKGTYYADEGDFSAAGAIQINYLNVMPRSVAKVEVGGYGLRRVLLVTSPRVGSGHLLAAVDLSGNDDPWERPDESRRVNGVIRYSRGEAPSGFSLTGMFYDARWNATDQVPRRLVDSGRLSRFGFIDATDGGRRTGTQSSPPGSGPRPGPCPASRPTRPGMD